MHNEFLKPRIETWAIFLFVRPKKSKNGKKVVFGKIDQTTKIQFDIDF